jgi:hypothetical protein
MKLDRRLVPVVLLATIGLGACFGDRDRDYDHEITAEELASHTPPPDSSLSAGQIDRYLRTLLEQIDLIVAEGPAVNRRAAMDTLHTGVALWSDYLVRAQTRAARRSGANPAEIEYVAARFGAVGRFYATTQAQESGPQVAASFRQQAEIMRGQPGVADHQITALLRAAEQAETAPAAAPSPSVAQNLEAARLARPAVTEEMWARLSRLAGGPNLMSLGDMSDTTATGGLAAVERVRPLVAAAVANRPLSVE